MKSLKNIIISTLATGSLLAITGCKGTTSINGNNYSTQNEISISATPLSTGESFARMGGTFSLYVSISGTNYLARTSSNDTDNNANAQALVNYEISKEGKIELTGRFNDGIFKFSKLKAGGYEVKF